MKSVTQKLRVLLYFSCFIVFVLSLSHLFHACSLFGSRRDDHGSFNYTQHREWKTMQPPWSMVLVPGGSFMSGEVDEDVFNKGAKNRRITISAFFMDETEVTNSAYRNFLDVLSARLENLPTSPASTASNDEDEEDESNFQDNLEAMLTQEYIEALYPDPDVWRKGFSNLISDPSLDVYFTHPGYDVYPVVGVTWEAARIYADWQTKHLNEYRTKKGLPPYPSFSLPGAAQWEYAARGGKELAKYPWGGPYIRDHEGNLRANFKSGKGNYSECGYAYTSPVYNFPPNDFGLYDMAGNVAEWTLDAYNPVAVSRTWDVNPVYLDDEQPIKIVKGGSWKDISRFLQTGAIDYEHKDVPRPYIGFRCVIPFVGPESVYHKN